MVDAEDRTLEPAEPSVGLVPCRWLIVGRLEVLVGRGLGIEEGREGI